MPQLATGVTDKLLKTRTVDLDETLEAYKAYPISVHRHILDLQS